MALQGAFDFPNYAYAIGLILLQWILLAVASWGFGLGVNPLLIGKYIATALLAVIVSSAFLVGVSKALKSKDARFSSTFTALSLLEFIKALSFVLAILLLLLFPSATGILQQANRGTLTTTELYNAVYNTFLNGPVVVALLVVLAAILLGAYSLYVLYLIIAKNTNSTVFKNLAILVILLLLSEIVVTYVANAAFRLVF